MPIASSRYDQQPARPRIESLEPRHLLATPAAGDDTLYAFANQTLVVAPTEPVTALLIDSAGDPVGQGMKKMYTPADSTVADYSAPYMIRYDWRQGTEIWELFFRAPDGISFSPGRDVPLEFVSLRGPGGDVPREAVTRFDIRHMALTPVFNSYRVSEFSGDFEITAPDSPPLRGSMHYNYRPTGSLLENDADADGHSLTARLVSQPANGTVQLNPDGTLNYQPAPGFVGTDAFTYVASDGVADGNVATVTVEVWPERMTTVASGRVEHVYPLHDGTTVTAPLAQRIVYDDANHNAAWDPGESATSTDDDGNYGVPLPGGVRTVRLLQRPGWAAPEGRPDVHTVAVGSAGQNLTVPPLSAAMARPSVIDVLMVYTPAVAQRLADGPTIAQRMHRANLPFANSDTNVRLNLVAAREINYAEAGLAQTDLTRLGKRDGHLDEVFAWRDQTRADVVILLTSGSSDDTVGIAYTYNGPRSSQLPFAVVTVQPGDETSFTLPHEVGHLLGAGHDLQTDRRAYKPYAHGWRIAGLPFNQSYKTIMTYGEGTEVPYFSSPDFSYAGQPLGNRAAADNARVVREVGPAVARYRLGGTEFLPRGRGELTAAAVRSPVRPGRRAPVTLRVANTGDGTLSGRAAVRLLLSPASDPTAARDLGLFTPNLRLKPGTTRNLRVTALFPPDLPPGDYRLRVEFVPASSQVTGDLITTPIEQSLSIA